MSSNIFHVHVQFQCTYLKALISSYKSTFIVSRKKELLILKVKNEQDRWRWSCYIFISSFAHNIYLFVSIITYQIFLWEVANDIYFFNSHQQHPNGKYNDFILNGMAKKRYVFFSHLAT